MSIPLASADDLVARNRSRGVAVDTALLMLLAVGQYERGYISKFKRTAQYSDEDYDILNRFLGGFNRLILSPHVLCEASNQSFQIPQARLGSYLGHFLSLISKLEEVYVPKESIITNSYVRRLGVTDTGLIISCVERGCLLLTTDRTLVGLARKEGVDVFHFDEIRGYNWFS